MSEQKKKEVNPIDTSEMFSIEDAKARFLEKHPPLSDEQIEEKKVEMTKAKKKYSKDLHKVEENLMTSLNMLFPIVDPMIDDAVGWIRQIPYWRLVESVPEELQSTEIPQEKKVEMILENKEYQLKTYELMAEFIEIPKKPMEWWRDKSPPRFLILFEKAMNEMYRQMEQDTDFL
jgi:hypothetical protein